MDNFAVFLHGEKGSRRPESIRSGGSKRKTNR